MRSVYLDNNATTRMDPLVLAAMLPTFGEQFGNAASTQHEFGRAAADLVEDARSVIAREVGARRQDICFTSGATESNNLAITGVLARSASAGLVTSPTEHKSVLDTAAHARRAGHPIAFVRLDALGVVDLDSLRQALGDETVLVSIMIANNEIGTLAPIAEVAEICKQQKVLLHCDATQALGRVPIDMSSLGIDLLSVSAHKLYGPKGVGALVVSRGVELEPLMHGGGHERGRRSGTLNVPGCVGFATACRIARARFDEDRAHCNLLRDRLFNLLRTDIPDLRLNGHPDARLAGNLNVCIPGCDADDLMLAMPDVAISSGSACTSASPEPSHVLRAIGLSYEDARSSIRLGVGRFTTLDEVEFAASRITETVHAFRGSVSRLLPVGTT